jgi:glyoxylase-like metal-dependent hydrolase (beta-lactamase superfamily II)
MKIQHFYDTRTHTLTYVVHDEETRDAVLIDPVLDYDPKAGRTFTESAEAVTAYVEREALELHLVLETHPHADHLTGARFFRERFGVRVGIGEGIRRVQETWREVFDLGEEFPVDGSQFDLLIEDGQVLEAGTLAVEAILTEGHTPASMTYAIGDALFVGDLIFMPDAGTARCDFPGGSAAVMYDAVHRLYERPDETRVFTLHDYQPGGRELAFESTIGEQKRSNVHVHEGVGREEFVARRAELERGKEMPTLLFPAVQVNIDGGRLPAPGPNGVAYLKTPLNRF